MRTEGAPSSLYMFPLSILFSIYPIKPITSKHLLRRCKVFIRDKIHNVWATKFNLKKLKTSRYSKEMQLFTQTIKSISLNLLLQYCLQSYFITKNFYLLYTYFYHLLRLCSKKNRPFHDFSIFDKELCIRISIDTARKRWYSGTSKQSKDTGPQSREIKCCAQILKIVYVR